MASTPDPGPAPSSATPGADPAAVGAWLAEQLGDPGWRDAALAPLGAGRAGQRGAPGWRDAALAPLGAGRSNLTYRIDSRAGQAVLRRPPTGEVAATAHDMGRERRVIAALAGTGVPVPRVLASSEGGPPVEAPCFVMELVEGVVPLGELPEGWAATEPERARAGHALVDVLVALHGVDPEAVGLGDFGRPEGFMARQVRRWGKQWEAARGEGAAPPETERELTRLAERLGSTVPASQRHTIVHGDYRIDNCLYDATDPGRIKAVLDWEMSTLGDPMADLGLLLVYWYHADEEPIWRAAQHLPSPTRLPGFPTRTDIAEAYARKSGLDLDPLPWYVGFGAFKLAVVLAGILARVRAGAVPASMAHGIEDAVDPLVALGHHVLDHGLE